MDNQGIKGWELIFQGGVFMLPLLVCSIFAFGIILEKFFFFKKIQINLTEFKKKIFELLRISKIKEALQHCEDSASPTAKIMKAGIIKYGCSREEIKASIEEAGLLEIPKLELRLNALSAIVQLSPLLGFLGSTIEMISNFRSLQARALAMNPATSADLTVAIAQDLLPTTARLTIAIITFAAYSYFVNRVNLLVIEMETSAAELTSFIAQTNEISS